MVSRKICLTLLVVACCSSSLASTRNLAPLWKNKEADVYFLVDSSSSVWIIDYGRMLDFVAMLVSDMDIGPQKTRVGLALYSVQFKEYIAIDSNRNKEELIRAIKDTPYETGNTYISRAIQGLRTVGLSPDKTRKGVPLIGVLITDGTSRHKELTLGNATLAKREGISLFTIGVGWDIDRFELMSIASDPKTDFVFYTYSFNDLANITRKVFTKMAAVEYLQRDQRGSCGGDEEADIVFVFDEAVFGRQDSIKIKDFISAVVKDLSVNSGMVRVGMMSKTCHEGQDINLNTYLKATDFEYGLKNSDKGPGIAILLRRAWQDGFLASNGGRSLAKKRIVLIINEPLPEAVRTLAVVARLRSEIFVVRIGNDYDKNALGSVASDNDHVTYFESTSFLDRGKSEFFASFCPGL